MNLLHALVRAIPRRPLLRQLVRPVVVFGALVLAGVAGFSTLASVGIVDALFWLLDPTSIELHFRAHDGPATLVKGYAVVILSGLVVAGLWIGETVFSAAFGGQLGTELTHMQIEQRIDELDAHVVVCGFGTFGKTVAQQLREEGADVVVIEQDANEHQRAVDEGFLALDGDARREETLLDAGIKRADTVVGAVDETNTNVQTAVVASQLAPTVTVVVRAGSERDRALARRVGADEVVVPEVVSGKQVSGSL